MILCIKRGVGTARLRWAPIGWAARLKNAPRLVLSVGAPSQRPLKIDSKKLQQNIWWIFANYYKVSFFELRAIRKSNRIWDLLFGEFLDGTEHEILKSNLETINFLMKIKLISLNKIFKLSSWFERNSHFYTLEPNQ